MSQLLGAIARAHGLVDRIAADLVARSKGLSDLADAAIVLYRDVAIEEASTTGDADTMRNRYVSADAGIAWGATLGTVVPYLGTNIYPRPVNKSAPLSRFGGWRRRASLTFGLTVKSVADDANTRSDIFGSQSIVAGAGYRMTQSLRLGTGIIVFKKKNEDPLRTYKPAAVDPYVAFSLDVDVAKLPAALGAFFK
jgi:hypothetical protein